MNDAGAAVRRVRVSAEQAVIGEVVQAALRERAFEPVGRDDVAEVGLLLSDLSEQLQVDFAQSVVADASVLWVVVSGTPRDPGWGAVLTAGAFCMVDSSCSIAQITELLGSLIEGTFVPGGELEPELCANWEDLLAAKT